MRDYKLHAKLKQKKSTIESEGKVNDSPSMCETNLLLDRVMRQNEVEVFDQHWILKVLNPKKIDELFR